MTRAVLLGLLLAALSAPAAQATDVETLRGVAAAGREASLAGDSQDARRASGHGFDTAAQRGDSLSPPPVPVPEGGSYKRPGATLIVGEPGRHRIREVANPLTKDGKAKPQKSGNWPWWTLAGAAAGAGVGFLLGGPIGAAIGALVGGLLGFFFGP